MSAAAFYVYYRLAKSLEWNEDGRLIVGVVGAGRAASARRECTPAWRVIALEGWVVLSGGRNAA